MHSGAEGARIVAESLFPGSQVPEGARKDGPRAGRFATAPEIGAAAALASIPPTPAGRSAGNLEKLCRDSFLRNLRSPRSMQRVVGKRSLPSRFDDCIFRHGQ